MEKVQTQRVCKHCGKELQENEIHIAVFDKATYRECWAYFKQQQLEEWF